MKTSEWIALAGAAMWDPLTGAPVQTAMPQRDGSSQVNGNWAYL